MKGLKQSQFHDDRHAVTQRSHLFVLFMLLSMLLSEFVAKSESHGNLPVSSIRTSRDGIQFYDKKQQFSENKQMRPLRDDHRGTVLTVAVFCLVLIVLRRGFLLSKH